MADIEHAMEKFSVLGWHKQDVLNGARSRQSKTKRTDVNMDIVKNLVCFIWRLNMQLITEVNMKKKSDFWQIYFLIISTQKKGDKATKVQIKKGQ